MTPEYVDASDLIQPDTRSDAQKWLAAEMDKRWANEQGAEPFPILESIALEVIEENQRLRAQIGQGETVAWKHDCAVLLANDVELWIDVCPHCGKPRYHPAPQQKPLLF